MTITNPKDLNEERMKQWSAIDHIYKTAERERRSLTGDEHHQIEVLNHSMNKLAASRDDAVREAEIARERGVSTEARERQYGADAERRVANEVRELRQWARGRGRDQRTGKPVPLHLNIRAAMQERDWIRQGASPEEVRALLGDTGSSGSLIPTTLSTFVFSFMESESAALRMPIRKVTTDSGEPMNFVKTTTHALATQVSGQGTAVAGVDPAFDRVEMRAWKYGILCDLSNEVVQDSGIDIMSYLAENLGRGIGRVFNTDLIVGTGTGEPLGIMNAGTGIGGTIVTGGSLITPSYENLVDLYSSIPDGARNDSAAWLMRDATAGNLRKLRDGAGGTTGAPLPLFTPSPTAGLPGGTPDYFMGRPLYTDGNVAALGSAALTIAFGNFNQGYLARLVGDVKVAVSDQVKFATDITQVRATWRGDGRAVDQTQYNRLRQAVS